MSSTNFKNKNEHYVKFKLGISKFLDASPFMWCSTLKIEKIFILGLLLFLLGKKTYFLALTLWG